MGMTDEILKRHEAAEREYGCRYGGDMMKGNVFM
jgi:hypothetical protein